MFCRFIISFFIAISLLAAVEMQRKTYDRYKLFRLFPNREQTGMVIREFQSHPDISFWRYSAGTGDPLDIQVSPNFTDTFNRFLEYYGIPYSALSNNLGRNLEQEIVGLRGEFPSKTSGINFKHYLRYKEIEEYLEEVVQKHPQVAQKTVIGRSSEGRNISLVKISTNSKWKSQPVILIDAGIHAREWISVSTALYIIHQLAEHSNENREMLGCLEWHIVPLLNPDGYEYTHTKDRMWRKNRSPIANSRCVGVDGNRNYGVSWNTSGASSYPCEEIYAGPSAFSELETRAMRDHAISLNGRGKVYLSLHSYGNFILHPWGYKKDVPVNGNEMKKIGLQASNISVANGGPAYRVGSSAILLYEGSGGSDDWMYAYGNFCFSYTIELTDTIYGFLLPKKLIESTVKTFFKALVPFALAGQQN